MRCCNDFVALLERSGNRRWPVIATSLELRAVATSSQGVRRATNACTASDTRAKSAVQVGVAR